jgi:perosamine synthetase
MVVHIYGLPVDISPVLEIAERYGLRVIEDAAEMHGQTYKGKPCGSFGDISTFSFYPNKHLTTGEGGMIVTDDDELAEACRSLRNLCFQPEKRFIHERLGWNLRMTNMQAALGIAQLEKLDDFIQKKRLMGKRYTELLADLPGLQLPLVRTSYADNIYWVYGLLLNESVGLNAQDVMKRLAGKGIGTRPFFYPMHLQPILQRMGLFAEKVQYPVAEIFYERGFYLPSGMALKESQIERCVMALRDVLT